MRGPSLGQQTPSNLPLHGKQCVLAVGKKPDPIRAPTPPAQLLSCSGPSASCCFSAETNSETLALISCCNSAAATDGSCFVASLGKRTCSLLMDTGRAACTSQGRRRGGWGPGLQTPIPCRWGRPRTSAWWAWSEEAKRRGYGTTASGESLKLTLDVGLVRPCTPRLVTGGESQRVLKQTSGRVMAMAITRREPSLTYHEQPRPGKECNSNAGNPAKAAQLHPLRYAVTSA